MDAESILHLREKVMLRWFNARLTDKFGPNCRVVSDIGKDLKDGVFLLNLVKALWNLDPPPFNQAARKKKEMLANVDLALGLLAQAGVPTRWFNSKDFVDCNLQEILNNLWVIVLFSDFKRFLPKPPKQTDSQEMTNDVAVQMIAWCKRRLADYDSVSVDDMSASFSDSMVLISLVHFMRSDAIDLKKIESGRHESNFRTVLETAESVLKIPPLLDVGDLLTVGGVDPVCVMTYLAEFLKYYRARYNRPGWRVGDAAPGIEAKRTPEVIEMTVGAKAKVVYSSGGTAVHVNSKAGKAKSKASKKKNKKKKKAEGSDEEESNDHGHGEGVTVIKVNKGGAGGDYGYGPGQYGGQYRAPPPLKDKKPGVWLTSRCPSCDFRNTFDCNNVVEVVCRSCNESYLPKPEAEEQVVTVTKEHEKFPWETDFDELEFDKKIGNGAFGIVFLGTWRLQEVAIKQLLDRQMTEAQFEEFYGECKLMMSLRPHKNLVQLLGVCVNPAKPLAIITDFYEGGSLYGLINQRDRELDWPLVNKILKGITAGMYHLHREQILHRDLAARNVLLSDTMDAKVADFGLSKKVLNPDEHQQEEFFRGAFKYMAPESLTSNIFSVKTDVWSFGVVVWEVITRRAPFSHMDIYKAARRVKKGTTLPVPYNCPEAVKDMLVDCFKFNPEERPTFDATAPYFKRLKAEIKDDANPLAPIPLEIPPPPPDQLKKTKKH